ncbi:MAG: ion transporter [Gemmatimonadota bacterium]
MTELTTPYGPHGPKPRTPAHDYHSDRRILVRPVWRRELYRIIFEHDTPAGRLFDVALIGVILASVGVVMIESVDSIAGVHGSTLKIVEWAFTTLFTIEYATRLIAARSASRYAWSFFGIIDLLAILPTFLGLIVTGGQALAVVRILRVLRVFRVLKLAQFIGSERLMLRALRQSGYKIAVFLFAVLTMVVVVGAAMYVIEGAANGFSSIPRGVYWAIVTVTTVGFGDITPSTPWGQVLAAFLMVVGYGIIAVPTGIVSAEIVAGRARGAQIDGGAMTPAARACPGCEATEHQRDATFCWQCGSELTA